MDEHQLYVNISPYNSFNKQHIMKSVCNVKRYAKT